MKLQKISKNLIKYIATSSLAFVLASSFSFANMIDENIYSIPVSQGVTFKKVEQTFTNGANSIYLTIADMSNPSLSLDLLYNNATGFTNRKKLSELDAQKPNAVASINADFFSMTTPSFAMGTMIENGKILSNATHKGNMAAMMIHNTGNIIFDYVPSGVSIRNDSNGMTLTGVNLNKTSSNYQSPTVITSEFRKQTIGSSAMELTEVIVENSVVREVRTGQGSTALGQNTFAIVASGAKGSELAYTFNVGDMVSVVSSAQNTYQDIQIAIGGGTVILRNGQLAPLTHTIPGKSQRTAVGVTFDNKLVFMVVDGRASAYAGMNESDVANFLKTQNVKDAMMFDGGGSSELIINKKITNLVKTERQIVNGIAISNNAPKGSLSKLEAVLETQTITQGDKVKLIVQGFDANMNPIVLNNITVTGSGVGVTYADGYITATQGGQGNIVVSAQGVSKSIPVKINKVESYDPYLKESTGSYDFAIVTNASSAKDDVLGQALNGKTLEALTKGKLAINVFNENAEFKNQIGIRKENLSKANDTVKTSTATVLAVNAKNGISSVAKQWDSIKNALNASTQNVILVLDSSFDLTASEKRVLRKLINESNKKVFVISFGSRFSSFAEGNASYITITDNSKSNQEYKMLSFRTQNGKLVYSFENIL